MLTLGGVQYEDPSTINTCSFVRYGHEVQNLAIKIKLINRREFVIMQPISFLNQLGL